MLSALIGQADRPNRITTKDKDEKYHTDFGRYCVFAGVNWKHDRFVMKTRINKRFYMNEQWILDEDLEAFFEDDTGNVRNRIKMQVNMIRPMIEQYRGNAVRMQINASCKSISPNAINRREQKLAEANFFADVANEMEPHVPEITQHLRKKMPIGKDQEETQAIFENRYVDEYNKAMTSLMQYIKNENRLPDHQIKIVENVALSGLGVEETFAHGGHQVFRWIESEDFFWDMSARLDDLSDSEFMGVINYLSPTEIFERWQNIDYAQREAIENFSKQFLKRTFDPEDQTRSMSGKCPVFRIFWRDSEKYDYGYVKDEFGYDYFTKIDVIEEGDDKPRYTEKDLITPSDPRAKKRMNGKKMISRYVDTLRFCEIIPKEFVIPENNDEKGTVDILLDWGIAPYQEVENERPGSVKFPFKCHCWAYIDGEVLSPIDDMIAPQRFVNRLMSIAENQINNSHGTITAIDKDMIDAQDGEHQIARDIAQGRIVALSSKGRGIQNAVGSFGSTLDRGTTALFEIINNVQEYTKNITGVNEALQGQSTGSDQLVGVTNILLQRGSLIQEPFYYAVSDIFIQCYQSMLTFGKRVYADNEKGLAIAVGDKDAEIIRITEDMLAEDFRAFVHRENDMDTLISSANAMMLQLYQLGLLDEKRFGSMFNRSTLDDVAIGLRESLKDKTEMARISQEEKQKQSDQLKQAIAQQNKAALMKEQVDQNTAERMQNKADQHDIDKIITQGIVKSHIQKEKNEGDKSFENNASSNRINEQQFQGSLNT